MDGGPEVLIAVICGSMRNIPVTGRNSFSLPHVIFRKAACAPKARSGPTA